MSTHNPQVFATNLGSKLATRSRHVCMFIGAGVARACGLPDVADLQEHVKSALIDKDREAFERLVTQLKYETRYKRLHLLEQMYKLALEALHQIQYSMQSGEKGSELAVSAAQFRLLVKDYTNLTREEYGETTTSALIHARRQTINVIKIIEVDPFNNGKIIDVEDFDVDA